MSNTKSNNLFIPIHMLWLYLPPYRKWLFIKIVFLMIFASLFEVVSIGAVIPMLTMIINPNLLIDQLKIYTTIPVLYLDEAQLKISVLTFFCVSVLIAGGLRIALLRVIAKFSLETCSDICAEIFLRTIFQPYIIQVSRNTSDIIHAILTQTNALIYEIVLPILTLASSIIMGAIILIAIISYSPSLAFFIFPIFGFTYACIAILSKKKLIANSEILNKSSSSIVRAVQESLGGIRDILLDNSQMVYYESFQKSNKLLRKTQARVSFISSVPRYVIEMIGMVMIALSAFIFQSPDDAGSISILPVLGGFALAAQRLLPIFQQAYSSWVSIRGGLSSLHSILDLLTQPSNIGSFERGRLIFNHRIKLSKISFRYPSSGDITLKEVSLEIKKGARIGIIGKTGSGKSTLLDVLMGLLQPTSGYIAIDDKEVLPHDLKKWQANISHVPQSIYLSDASISENIAFGVPKNLIDDSLVRASATQAQIANLIDSWPMGYETLVGERGVKLSGGQRQRIGIARALYKQSEVIIFDEATSSLDVDTENDVMNALEELNQNLTIIMVTHRLSTLKNCSEIYKIENGEISLIIKSELNKL